MGFLFFGRRINIGEVTLPTFYKLHSFNQKATAANLRFRQPVELACAAGEYTRTGPAVCQWPNELNLLLVLLHLTNCVTRTEIAFHVAGK